MRLHLHASSTLFLLALSFPVTSHAGNLTWNTGTGTWNTSTANWTGDATVFTDGGVDAVTFNSTTGGTITISANMSPISTTVSAASGTYTFNGGPIDSGTLTKSGGGALTISAAHSYTGATTINGTGALTVTSALANGGLNSSIGASSNAASNLIISGSTAGGTNNTGLIISSASTTDRLFTIGANATLRANQATSFTNTGAVAFTAPNTTTSFVLASSNTTFSFSPQITDNGTGVTSLTVATGTQNFTLNNSTNSYTGSTNLFTGNGQIVQVTKLADGGQASSIGASSNNNNNFQVTGGITLRYLGSGDSSDRNYRINGNAVKNMNWEASGTGALVLTGAAVYTNTSSAATFTLGGVSAANLKNSYGGVIANAGTGVVTFVKAGSNTWVLGGNNTYTGTTSINQGTLLINGNQTVASGAVTVAGGATLGGGGTVGGATTVNDTAVLSPGDGSGILSFAGNLVFGGGDSKSIFDLATGVRGTNYDGVTVGGALTFGGDLTLSIDAALADGTYNLFDFGSESGNLDTILFGGAGPYSGSFTLGTPNLWTASSGSQNFTFSQLTGDLTVAAVPEPSVTGVLICGFAILLCFGRRRHSAGNS